MKRIIMGIVAGVAAFSVTLAPAFAAETAEFTDLNGRSDEAIIEKWCDYGIVQGYGGAFRPDAPVTVSELDIMLDRLMGREVSDWSKSENLLHKGAVDQIQVDFVKLTDQEADQKTGVVDEKMTRSEAIALLESLVGTVDTVYDHGYLSKLTGGFTDTLQKTVGDAGWTTEEFQRVCELPATSMSAVELSNLIKIRDAQLKPEKDTLVQKVITAYDMENYLSGKYKTPKGFISICADVKQYVTLEDCYYGLRLDYSGTYFKPDDEIFAVIRFTADNAGDSTIPKSPAAGGGVTDPYPFGGAGFTTGTNGRMGSPEWVLPTFAEMGGGGGQILTIAQDGKEMVTGVYCDYAERFLNLSIDPEK